MSVLKSLAAWLDPDAAAARTESKLALLDAQDEINDLTHRIELLESSNQNLINKLADAAKTITNLREAAKSAKVELAVGRSYALDALDDAEAQLDGLAPRSKKRAALQATIQSVKTDVANISTAIEELKA